MSARMQRVLADKSIGRYVLLEASDDRFNDSLRILGASNRDGNHPGFLGGIIIPSWKQGVPDEDHLFQGDAEDVSQLSYAVSLVDAGFRDIDGSRPAHAHREFGQQDVEERFDLLAFGVVGVPLALLIQGGVLTESGISNLAASIFEGF